MPVQGRHIEIRGVVQGVGFRPWVWQLATREGVTGRVWNDARGVQIDAFGDDLERFVERLTREATARYSPAGRPGTLNRPSRSV